MKQMQILFPGYKICPAWLKLVYRKSANFICKGCGRHEDTIGILSAHRLIRGSKGGLYTIVPFNHPENNVKPCCNYKGKIDGKISCHKLYHANDNRRVSCN